MEITMHDTEPIISFAGVDYSLDEWKQFIDRAKKTLWQAKRMRRDADGALRKAHRMNELLGALDVPLEVE